MAKALIIVDMQNDFIRGALGSKEAVAIVDNVKERAEKLVAEGYTAFFTRDTHDEDYMETFEGKYLPVKHCIDNSDGWQIIPELRNIAGFYLRKYTFGYNAWDKMFNMVFRNDEVEEIELMGVCTDIVWCQTLWFYECYIQIRKLQYTQTAVQELHQKSIKLPWK